MHNVMLGRALMLAAALAAGSTVAQDFAPITRVSSVPHLLVAHPSVGVRTVKDLIALAKAKPGQITFPSAGNGSTPHLAGEIFKTMTGA